MKNGPIAGRGRIATVRDNFDKFRRDLFAK